MYLSRAKISGCAAFHYKKDAALSLQYLKFIGSVEIRRHSATFAA